MFPTASSRVYYNEEGEPLGWDNGGYDEPEYCDDCGGSHNTAHCRADDYDEDDE